MACGIWRSTRRAAQRFMAKNAAFSAAGYGSYRADGSLSSLSQMTVDNAISFERIMGPPELTDRERSAESGTPNPAGSAASPPPERLLNLSHVASTNEKPKPATTEEEPKSSMPVPVRRSRTTERCSQVLLPLSLLASIVVAGFLAAVVVWGEPPLAQDVVDV